MFELLLERLPQALKANINASSLQHALKQLRKDIESEDPRASLEIQKDCVRLVANDETLFDQHMRRNVIQKKAIAGTLWNWLFDFPEFGKKPPTEVWKGVENLLPTNNKIKLRMERKRDVLRSRVNPAFVIDAGSTNTIAITRFLSTAKTIPFVIWEQNTEQRQSKDADNIAASSIEGATKEEPYHSGYHKLVSPVIMTNSIVIADKIATSKFRQSIVLRLIGGTDRPERRSICGELALLWLRSCDQDGKLISLDLAIIGATGLETKRFEKPVLECDAAEEASLKSRLLAMSKFRIVLLDSEKLLKGGGTSMFAAVSEGDIDLIITDSGTDEDVRESVKDLARLCDRFGVGLIIANL